MSKVEKRANQRVPVALRVKLRYRNVDTFVSKFATNISTTGIFISSRKPKPVGTQLRFELRLADDSIAIAGRGRVSWILPFRESHPKALHGMGIEFTRLAKGSRELVQTIVAERIEQGLGETDDIPFYQSSPAPPPLRALSEEYVEIEGRAVSEGILEEPAPPYRTPTPTQKRAQTETTPTANASPPALAPKRLDLNAVLQRARDLVGKTSSTDEELASLFRVSAAPVAETLDAASDQLAQFLSGKTKPYKAPKPAVLPVDEAVATTQYKAIASELDAPPTTTRAQTEDADLLEIVEEDLLIEDREQEDTTASTALSAPSLAEASTSSDSVDTLAASPESLEEEPEESLGVPLDCIEDSESQAFAILESTAEIQEVDPDDVLTGEYQGNPYALDDQSDEIPTTELNALPEFSSKSNEPKQAPATFPLQVAREESSALLGALESLEEEEEENASLADALAGLEEESSSTKLDTPMEMQNVPALGEALEDVLAGLESDDDHTPATQIPSGVGPSGSVDIALDDDLLSDFEIVEDSNDDFRYS